MKNDVKKLSEMKNQMSNSADISNNIKQVVENVMNISVEGVFPNIDELFSMMDVRSKCGELTMPLALILSVMSRGIRDGDPTVLKLFYDIWRDLFGFDGDEGTGFGQLLSAIKYIRFDGES